jgi:hypothetical protein
VHPATPEGEAQAVTEPRPIRVIIAEDAYLIREALLLILSGVAEVEVVSAVSDGATLRAGRGCPGGAVERLRFGTGSRADFPAGPRHVTDRKPIPALERWDRRPQTEAGSTTGDPDRGVRWRIAATLISPIR